MDPIRITEHVFYISGPANIGVVVLENSDVALIDSGTDEKYAVKVMELLTDYRFKITHILNTHSHADHIGGNSLIQAKTGCKILAAPLEVPTICQPLIQSVVLFSGAPVKDIMNRFVMANPSHAEVMNTNELQLGNKLVKVIDIPGHSVNQKGFLINNVAFVADAIFPDSFFKKQRLPFNYDPSAHNQTLEKLKNLQAEYFVGGHFKAQKSIQSMISTNQSHLHESVDFMLRLLKIPQPQERIVKAFLDHFGLRKSNWEYFLYRATVNGYLSSLHKHGKINYKVMDNLAVWYAI